MSFDNFHPRSDIAWVRPLLDERLTESIIFTKPDEKVLIGEVLKVGVGRKIRGKICPIGVKEGDKVIFADTTGETLTWEGEQLLAMREFDIMGVIEN